MRKIKYLEISFRFVFVLLMSTAMGQELPEVTPPSPNAASLAKYVEIPVSHYTGLPNINIPLYTVVSGTMEVPIGLSYHARGVKVEEIASNYGMGWSLQAGGVVTRQIRGRADDQAQGYLGQSYYDSFFTSETTRKNAMNADLNDDFDRDPDLFTFNFLGFSGKFIYDRDSNEPILQTYDDLKIETIGNPSSNIQGFVITDAGGAKYYFGQSQNGSVTARDKDHTEINYSYSSNGLKSTPGLPSGKFTSWYLMEIIDPIGRVVSFTYESEPGLRYSETYRKSQEVAEKSGSRFIKTAYFSKVRIYQKKISRITFDQGVVNFNYAFARQDLNNSTALSSVEVLNRQNQRIKKYVFDYFHMDSGNGSSNMIYSLYQFEPEARKRLFLRSITEEGANNLLLPPYKFSYDPTVLPNRFTTSYDKWGYYNGKNNGTFAVFTENATEIAGRSIDTVKCQAGLLKKIEYPTGGWSTYEYESNRAVLPTKFKNSITFSGSNNNPIIDKFVTLEKDPEFYNSQTKTYSAPFTIGPNLIKANPNDTGALRTAVLLDYETCTNQESYDCPYLVRIHKSDGSLYGVLHNTNNSYVPISIVPGDYVLRVISNNPSIEDPTDFENNLFEVILEWKEFVDNNTGGDSEETTIVYTGGNRIKKTTLNDGNGQSIIKTYEYTDASGLTSGRLFSLPSYYEFYTITIAGGQQLRALKAIVTKPANTLTYEQGNHGGYEFVTEYYGDQQNNRGKTAYQFTVFDNTGAFYKFPYFLPTDNEWLRGKPLEVKNYKNNNGSYELVSEAKQTYEYGGFAGSHHHLLYPEDDENGHIIFDDATYNFVKLAAWNGIYDPRWTPENSHNLYTPYYLNMGSLKLKKIESINYYDSKKINNTTEYFYNYEDHYQTKYVKHTRSNGKTYYTETIYPQDKRNVSSAERKLKELHQYVPLEINTYEGKLTDFSDPNPSKTIRKQKNEFSEFFTDILLPSRALLSKGDKPLEERVRYHKYDAKGNPLEVSQTDGARTIYVWGYQDQYPIAKIQDASYSSLTTAQRNAINKAKTASDADVDLVKENALRFLLNSVKKAFPDSMISTYTYDPLVGVTSMTDTKGYTTFYKYDAFNRLEYVKDNKRDIISENKYHYKNQ